MAGQNRIRRDIVGQEREGTSWRDRKGQEFG